MARKDTCPGHRTNWWARPSVSHCDEVVPAKASSKNTQLSQYEIRSILNYIGDRILYLDSHCVWGGFLLSSSVVTKESLALVRAGLGPGCLVRLRHRRRPRRFGLITSRAMDENPPGHDRQAHITHPVAAKCAHHFLQGSP